MYRTGFTLAYEPNLPKLSIKKADDAKRDAVVSLLLRLAFLVAIM